jgi:hypothetical protein
MAAFRVGHAQLEYAMTGSRSMLAWLLGWALFTLSARTIAQNADELAKQLSNPIASLTACRSSSSETGHFAPTAHRTPPRRRERVFEVSRPVDAHPKPEYLAAYMSITTVRAPVWLEDGSRYRL